MIDFQSIPCILSASRYECKRFPDSVVSYSAKMSRRRSTEELDKERTPFGARLYAARTEADLKQGQLAKMVGMSQSTLAEAETVRDGSTYTVQLALACGVNPLWLATGDGDKHPAPSNVTPLKTFADLTAFEGVLIDVLRQNFTAEELLQLTEAVKAAAKTKAIRVSTGQEVGTVGVYFGVDRRTTDVSVAADRRELAPWDRKKKPRPSGPEESSK